MSTTLSKFEYKKISNLGLETHKVGWVEFFSDDFGSSLSHSGIEYPWKVIPVYESSLEISWKRPSMPRIPPKVWSKVTFLKFYTF